MVIQNRWKKILFILFISTLFVGCAFAANSALCVEENLVVAGHGPMLGADHDLEVVDLGTKLLHDGNDPVGVLVRAFLLVGYGANLMMRLV